MPAAPCLFRVASDKSAVRFADLSDAPETLPEGVEEFLLPQVSLSTLKDEERDLLAEAEKGETFLAEAAKSRVHLQAAQERALANLTFETILTGMEGEGPVVWVSGWVPVKDAARLVEAAAKHGWGLLLDDPSADEQPPTKVENNALVRHHRARLRLPGHGPELSGIRHLRPRS